MSSSTAPNADLNTPTATLHDLHDSYWSEFEVAELTWVDGQPRVLSSGVTWEKADEGGGTLQSLVDGATGQTYDSIHYDILGPWPGEHGSCPAIDLRSVPTVESDVNASLTEPVLPVGTDAAASLRDRKRDSTQVQPEAATISPTFLGENQAVVDIRVFLTSCRQVLKENEEKKGNGSRASKSTKRKRHASAHNESERRRRERFNCRMKTLQKLLPSPNKNDKVSILDEVISYTQKLQTQMQMQMMPNFPPMNMMMPMMAVMQQFQIAMMAQYSMMAQMGMNPSLNISQPTPSSSFSSLAGSWNSSNITDSRVSSRAQSSTNKVVLSRAGSSPLPNNDDMSSKF